MFDPKLMRFSARMSSLVLGLGGLVYGAFWAGQKLDAQFNCSPAFVLGLMLVCSGLGLWAILALASKSDL